MLDLVRHIVNQEAGGMAELINQKRAGKIIRPKQRPKGEKWSM